MAPSSSDSRRRHVTTACVPCRESKIKCDGITPSCTSCTSKGKECHYLSSDDKRKLTPRLAVDLLYKRIKQLSAFIDDHNFSPPPMPADEQVALKRVLNHLRRQHVAESHVLFMTTTHENKPVTQTGPSTAGPASEKHRRMTEPAHSRPALLGRNSEDYADFSVDSNANVSDLAAFDILQQPIDLNIDPGPFFEPSFLPTAVMSDGSLPTFSGSRLNEEYFPNTGIDASCNTFSSSADNGNLSDSPIGLTFTPDPDLNQRQDDETESLIEQLSDRIGSLQIGPGGQVRHYGPTSNFNLVEMPAPDNLTVHRTVPGDGQEYLDRLGIGKEVPLELEKHLADLYFAWQDPTFHAVDRAIYDSARIAWMEDGKASLYYSDALQNAICALGAAFEARFHPTFITFPKSLADFFADRAKALIEIELDCPCIATVQAMIVLSSHDIGCKRDSRGWLYSGMAMRLAFDLALHVDLTEYVEKKHLTQADADARRDVFFAAYAIDHMWGFYLGRPLRTNMEDVTVSKPSEGVTPDCIQHWIPYTSPRSHTECTALPDFTQQIHRQRVYLVEIMTPLAHALYGNRSIPQGTLHAVNVKTVASLLKWKANLPSTLHVALDDYETPYLPHVLLLHMQYYQNLIHAHRPWMSRTYIQPNPPRGPGSGHARQMCIESAFSITKLLQIYERRYALRRMNILGVGITCSAALLLIFATVSQYRILDESQDLGFHISTCFRALDELGASWESAKRAREFLILLQRRWESWKRSPKVRRASQAMPPGQSPSKRHRSNVADVRNEDAAGGDVGGSLQHSELLAQYTPEDLAMGIDLDWIFAMDA
ncbi:hypothetical protein HIM_08460 [Hirsutella minnesotensis 3608]|uniref:Zn(2)-C6 fungal-type domain-containing protein n=1 Tax=Hirsutella minnesotensis 3608 TaxID=1043627 RepID=A0A0F7ZML2_9HYPO|nr:hypothetical protein HIM_08460 [Hirsutella minnesotensis 3608]